MSFNTKIYLFALVIFAACNGENTNTSTQSALAKNDDLFLAQGELVLKSIVKKDYASLTTFMAANDSLLFSPFDYIDKERNTKLVAADIIKAANSRTKLDWGDSYGEDSPIMLSINDYFDKYVYDQPFINADSVKINSSVVQGSSVNNIKEVFPACNYVHYYIDPKDEKMGGLDWRSLDLVFKTIDNKPYLIAIIHNEWTP